MMSEREEMTLDVEKRRSGGPGIYMVKKSMAETSCERRDGQNILTIHKKF